jgi:hypothetical protein
MLHPTKQFSLDMYMDEFTGMWNQKLFSWRDNMFFRTGYTLPSAAA